MNKSIGIAWYTLPGLLLLSACMHEPGANPVQSSPDPVFEGGGFNQYGYNLKARQFKGIADGADWNFDGKYFHDVARANYELTMNWNREWERGIDEAWQNPPYDATCRYAWKTDRQNGVLMMWKYDIIWVGPEQEESPRWKQYGFLIWDEFEVNFSGITAGTIQFWETNALPSGTVCPTF